VYTLRQLTFAQLRTRFIAATRHRIHNGEFTERGLARLAGISQPHLHNILKGVRDLTPAVADALLVAMDLGLLDLVEPDELGHAVESMQVSGSNSRVIPVLRGRIGPGLQLPDSRLPIGWRPLPSAIPITARRPAIALLGPDPHLAAVFPGAKAAVLDLDEVARSRPEAPSWYVVRHPSGGLIRQVRLQGRRLEILGQAGLAEEQIKWDLPLGSASVLHVVRARVVWAGATLEWPLAEAGELPEL